MAVSLSVNSWAHRACCVNIVGKNSEYRSVGGVINIGRKLENSHNIVMIFRCYNLI